MKVPFYLISQSFFFLWRLFYPPPLLKFEPLSPRSLNFPLSPSRFSPFCDALAKESSHRTTPSAVRFRASGLISTLLSFVSDRIALHPSCYFVRIFSAPGPLQMPSGAVHEAVSNSSFSAFVRKLEGVVLGVSPPPVRTPSMDHPSFPSPPVVWASLQAVLTSPSGDGAGGSPRPAPALVSPVRPLMSRCLYIWLDFPGAKNSSSVPLRESSPGPFLLRFFGGL